MAKRSAIRFPSIRNVAKALSGVKQHCEPYSDTGRDVDDSASWVDVRLQVDPEGYWSVHSGDSSYDQDHRGYWGASSVSRRSNMREVAAELIEQAKDHYAECRADEAQEV